MLIDEITLDLPPWMASYELPARYKVAYGGRGSSKSWGFARRLLIRSLEQPGRILCCRELQNSIKDSVFQLLLEQIETLRLTQYFEAGASYLRARDTGTDFLFKGLRANAQEIKSTEGVTVCWVEEAQGVSEESWKYLVPTIRKPGSEIWVTFNPGLDTDPAYVRFVKNTPPGTILKKVNWQDNPWFPQVLRDEMEYMRSVDLDGYMHVWEGECVLHTEAQVLAGKVVSEEFYPAAEWDGPYYGADWGYSIDPTAVVKCWLHGRTLYVEHEAYGRHVDLDALPSLFDTIPDVRRFVVRADKSRPETIAHMVRRGFRVHPAMQGPGSVEDGIAQLRGFERIVVHPRCKHTLEESRLWQYKVDRLTGDVLPTLKQGNDHCWDAVRYAIEPLIGSRDKVVLDMPSYSRPSPGSAGWMG
jgi:phage terminase large subunit